MLPNHLRACDSNMGLLEVSRGVWHRKFGIWSFGFHQLKGEVLIELVPVNLTLPRSDWGNTLRYCWLPLAGLEQFFLVTWAKFSCGGGFCCWSVPLVRHEERVWARGSNIYVHGTKNFTVQYFISASPSSWCMFMHTQGAFRNCRNNTLQTSRSCVIKCLHATIATTQ